MRMWMVPTELMCNRHLLGEHVELHMIVGSINKKKNLKGYYDRNLICTSDISKRHEELAKEMRKRGMNHKSELNYVDAINKGEIFVKGNLKDLANRCERCRARYVL